MIHLDRNHHPSPLETTTQNKHHILPTNPISWPALDDDFPTDDYPHVPHNNPSASKGPVTPTDAADPRPASAASSPASPADGNSASPTRERSSSLSPAPSPRPAQDAPTAVSTPLSELSPPPDDFDDDASKQDDAPDKPKDTASSAPASPPSKPDDHDVKPSQQSSNLMPASSPSTRPSPPIDSIATPSASGTEPTSPTAGDPKVVVLLELNEELLKCVACFAIGTHSHRTFPESAWSFRSGRWRCQNPNSRREYKCLLWPCWDLNFCQIFGATAVKFGVVRECSGRSSGASYLCFRNWSEPFFCSTK
jgi:hypothetical protein